MLPLSAQNLPDRSTSRYFFPSGAGRLFLIFWLVGGTVQAQTPTPIDCATDTLSLRYQQAVSLKRAGEGAEARELFSEIATCLDSPRIVAKCLYHLATLYEGSGERKAAVFHFEKAIALSLAHPPVNAVLVREARLAIGRNYVRWGDHATAITYFQQALPLAAGNATATASVLIDLGQAYQHQGGLPQAQQYYRQGLALEELPVNSSLRGFLHKGLGDITKQESNYGAALSHYQAAYPLLLDLDPLYGLPILGGIGETYFLMNQPTLAFKTLTRAIELGEEEISQTRELAKLYLLRGQLYERRVAPEQALSDFHQALRQIIPSLSPDSLYQIPEELDTLPENVLMDALSGKARVLQTLGQTNSEQIFHQTLALQHWQAALRSQACLRRQYVEHEAKFELVRETRELTEPALDDAWWLYQHAQADQWLAIAFELAERSKASLMLELMRRLKARNFAEIPPQDRARWDSLQTQIDQLDRKLNATTLDDSSRSRLQNERFAHNQALQQLEQTWQAQYQSYQALTQDISVAPLQELIPLIGDSSALISYSISQQNSYAFVLRADTRYWVRLPHTPRLNADILAFRQAIQAQDRSQDSLAYRLYQQLIQPLRRKLDGIRRLVIVPDQALALLPFEALLTEPVSAPTPSFQKPFLLQDFTVSYAFSATLWRSMQTASDDKPVNPQILAVAPEFKLNPRLQASAADPTRSCLSLIGNMEEVESLAELASIARLIGPSATREQLLDQLHSYAFVHIATHAIADDIDPDKTFLVLSEPGGALEMCGETYPDLGALYVEELFRSKIPAEIVVLAACQTGIGKLHYGEGLSSLARGFAIAGAKSVVASLWSVSDESTRAMMPGFYSYLGGGLPKDEALRQTKLDMLNKGKGEPYYWAGFVVMGNTEVVHLPGPGSPLLNWLGLGGLLLLGAFIFSKLRPLFKKTEA